MDLDILMSCLRNWRCLVSGMFTRSSSRSSLSSKFLPTLSGGDPESSSIVTRLDESQTSTGDEVGMPRLTIFNMLIVETLIVVKILATPTRGRVALEVLLISALFSLILSNLQGKEKYLTKEIIKEY